MRVAVVGCGFVADFYLKTLSAHPQLEVAGVMDQGRDRARASVPPFRALLLARDGADTRYFECRSFGRFLRDQLLFRPD